MFTPLTSALAGRSGQVDELARCRHRLIATDVPFSIAERPEILQNCDVATLFRWGDLIGDFSGFDLENATQLRLEHGGSRLSAYSLRHREIHDRCSILAEEMIRRIGLEGWLEAGKIAPLAYCADELFKFMAKVAAVQAIMADPVFDQIVLVQGRSCRVLDVVLRLQAAEGKSVWLTWADTRPAGQDANQRGLVALLRNHAGHTSDFRKRLRRTGEPSAHHSAKSAPQLWDRLASTARARETETPCSQPGEDGVLVLAPASRSVRALIDPIVQRLSQDWSVDAGLQTSPPRRWSGSLRTHVFSSPGKRELSDYSEFHHSLLGARAAEISSLFQLAENPLETAALDLRIPTLIKRDLPHLIAQAGRIEGILAAGRHKALIALGARSPWVISGIEAARRLGIPSVTVELNAITSEYPRYTRTRSDYVALSSDFAADDHVRHFSLDRSRLRVVGLPGLVKAPPRQPGGAWRVMFIAQPLTADLLWASWRMVLKAVEAIGPVQLIFRRHPLQDLSVERRAGQIAEEHGMPVAFSDPAEAITGVLESVDVVTACFSTVALQSIWSGVPTVIIAPDGVRLPRIFDSAIGIPQMTSADELHSMLLSLRAREGEGWRRGRLSQERVRQALRPLNLDDIASLVEAAVSRGRAGIRDIEDLKRVPVYVASDAEGLQG